ARANAWTCRSDWFIRWKRSRMPSCLNFPPSTSTAIRIGWCAATESGTGANRSMPLLRRGEIRRAYFVSGNRLVFALRRKWYIVGRRAARSRDGESSIDYRRDRTGWLLPSRVSSEKGLRSAWDGAPHFEFRHGTNRSSAQG